MWRLQCTVNVQGVQAIADIAAVVDAAKQLQMFQENTTVSGQLFSSETVKVSSQTNTPPPASDFTLPAICNGNSPRLHAVRHPVYPMANKLATRIARYFIRKP